MTYCIWCNEEFDDTVSPANDYWPYCSSLCASHAEQDSAEDEPSSEESA